MFFYTPTLAEFCNVGPVQEKPEPVKSDARGIDLGAGRGAFLQDSLERA
jgi:hypothetical protein